MGSHQPATMGRGVKLVSERVLLPASRLRLLPLPLQRVLLPLLLVAGATAPALFVLYRRFVGQGGGRGGWGGIGSGPDGGGCDVTAGTI